MTTLSPNQIALVIYQVGGWGPGPFPSDNAATTAKTAAWLDTAIAVCLSESGGNTDSKNATSTASGLWQILVSAHKAEITASIASQKIGMSSGPERDALSIFDPYVNTDVAHKVYAAAGGWSPWVAYTSGAYKKNTGHGATALAYIKGLSPAERKARITGGTIEGTKVAPDAPDGIIENLQYMWNNGLGIIVNAEKQAGITVGVFLLALVLLVLGVWFIMSNNAKKLAASQIAPVIKAVAK